MKRALIFLGAIGFGVAISSYLFTENKRRQRRSGLQDTNLIDINQATLSDFTGRCALQPELASRIIENRPYITKIDLISRRIIPDASYELIKRDITVRHAS